MHRVFVYTCRGNVLILGYSKLLKPHNDEELNHLQQFLIALGNTFESVNYKTQNTHCTDLEVLPLDTE